MRYSIKGALSRAVCMLPWMVTCLAWDAVMAQNEKLKDDRGRSIEVRIIGATETHVICIKSNDKKEIQIPLEKLDVESKKKVEVWRIETGRLPTKEMSMVVKSNEDRPKSYLVKFKVPEGNYNSSQTEKNRITLNFDSAGPGSSRGALYIGVDPINKRKEEVADQILAQFQEELERRLSRLTPNQRIEIERDIKIKKISHGEFTGYMLDPNDLGFAQWIQTTNGKFHIHASVGPLAQGRKEKALIEYGDVVKILETITISRNP